MALEPFAPFNGVTWGPSPMGGTSVFSYIFMIVMKNLATPGIEPRTPVLVSISASHSHSSLVWYTHCGTDMSNGKPWQFNSYNSYNINYIFNHPKLKTACPWLHIWENFSSKNVYIYCFIYAFVLYINCVQIIAPLLLWVSTMFRPQFGNLIFKSLWDIMTYSKNSVSTCLLQFDQAQGYALWSNILDITLCTLELSR
jgi:hypothetical protein